jgi:hypothetical protein
MTLPPTPSDTLGTAPFFDLMRILINQFRGLLANNGVKLTTDDTHALANAIADNTQHDKLADSQAVMQTLVDESLTLIADRWGLSFAECLHADMNSIQAWETTADFLEIANDKSNAELRVSAGSTLLVAMGNYAYVGYLVDVVEHDAGAMDVDAIFAKRTLVHVSGVDGDAEDWLAHVQQWHTNTNA